ADFPQCNRHVRFPPNSARETGLSQPAMSALPPKADMCGALAHVCFWPKADIDRLFDHFIGAQQEGYRDRQTNLLGRFKVHNQLKSRRVLYREVGRLGTFENSIHVVSYAAKVIIPIDAVGHQTTSCYVLG